MALSSDINDREKAKFLESSDVAGQTGIVVLNPDGSSVGTGGGGGTQYADGAAAATPTGNQINWNESGTQRAVSPAKPLPAEIYSSGSAISSGNPLPVDVNSILSGDVNANLYIGGTVASNSNHVPVQLYDDSGSLLTYPYGVQITDGTNTASVLPADNNGLRTGYAVKTYTFSVSTTGVIGPYDVEGYSWVTVQFTSVGSGGTIAGQFSADDGTTWVSPNVWHNSAVSTNAVGGITFATSTIQEARIVGSDFRLNLTALGSGTVAGTIKLHTAPWPMRTIGASVGPNTSIAQAVSSSAYYIGVNARSTSPTAATSGNMVGVTANIMGELSTTTGGILTTAIAAATVGNTVVKNAAGRLARVLVTATGTNPMVIHDNASTASGTIIGALPASPAVGEIYDLQMPAANGITVAGNSNNPGVTISYI